jgi:hypothetical protein
VPATLAVETVALYPNVAGEQNTMNITAWLDVAIGLSIIYLGASLFVTILNEYIQHLLNLRGRNLATSLLELIDEVGVREKLRKSPALALFFDDSPGDAPSYADPIVFAKLLVGSISTESAESAAKRLSEGLARLEESTLKHQLQALVKATTDNVEDLVTATSEWLDRSLTVLGETYKRRLQWISFGVGLAVAGACNIDTFALIDHLYRDKQARDAAVELAVQVTTATDEQTFDRCLALTTKERNEDLKCAELVKLVDAVASKNDSLAQLPLGWDAPMPPLEPWPIALKGLGWLVTALALSLGAPFWFDLLNRFVSVRHGMKKPSADSKNANPPPVKSR